MQRSFPSMPAQARSSGVPAAGGGFFMPAGGGGGGSFRMPTGNRGNMGMEQHGTGDPDERPTPLAGLTSLRGCGSCAEKLRARATGIAGLGTFADVNVDTADIADTANSYKWIAIIGGVVIMTILFYPEIKGLTSSFRK
jgi:hypothetical protein